jgi:hypothetical protein
MKLFVPLIMLLLVPSIVTAQSNLTVKSLNNIQFADAYPNASTDIGQAITAAQTTLINDKFSGGRIHVAAKPGGGCWPLTSGVTLTIPVILEGDGNATCITVSATIAIDVAWGSAHIPGAIRNLTLNSSTAGTGTAMTIGLSKEADQVLIEGVVFSGFATAMLQENSSFNITIQDSVFSGNTVGLEFPGVNGLNHSEEDRLINNAFTGNGTCVSVQTGGVDLYLYSNTFDDSKTAIAIGDGTSPDVGSSIHGFGNHFENGSLSPATYIIVNLATPLEQGPFVELHGGQFLNHIGGGSLSEFIDFTNGDTLIIDGVEFSSNQTVSQLVADNATNPSPSVFMRPVVRSTNVTTDCTGCNGGRFYDMPLRAVGLSAASTHNVNWTFGNNVTVNVK